MAQDISGAAGGGATMVVPGEMAARIDRLPRSFMLWEITPLVQPAWGIAASTDGIARTLYSFLRLPGHDITSFEYSVLYALPHTTYHPELSGPHVGVKPRSVQ